MHEFRRCVAQYEADYRLRRFSCWDQFLCMAFAQLTYRESLRDIEAAQFIDPLEGCCLFGYFGYHSAGVKPARATMAGHETSQEWRAMMGQVQV